MADVDAETIPLCVDLDGTLVRTDMLHEALLLLAKSSPRSLPALPAWLLRGKAGFKHLVAERVTIDPAALPYRATVLDMIAEARAAGRPVVLATAAPTRIATAIADHLGLFDEVVSSDRETNLSADAKARALVQRYGERGFDYVGNDHADLPVLARARRAFLISSSGRLRRAALARGHDALTLLDDPRGGIRTWRKALRVHQWLKNLLVFVPIFAAHEASDSARLGAAIVAFLSFSLCASSVYFLNDLLDLSSDRVHHRKKERPFASGASPVAAGIVAAPLLLAASLGLALLLPRAFLGVLLLYCGLTSAYSFYLKRQVVVDVMLLASLYTIRIIAGSAATLIRPSFWLLALSMFTFLCLAMVKRYSELRVAVGSGQPLAGRGYMPADLPVVLALGVSSGMVSVLILAMYTQAAIVPEMYSAPEWLWLAPPLMLYWITRLWMKAQRGEVDEDPVVFAMRDWQSLVILVLMGGAFALAASGWQPW